MRYGSLIIVAIALGGCGLFTPSRPIGVIVPDKSANVTPEFVLENSTSKNTGEEKVPELIRRVQRGEIKSIAQGLSQTSREYYIQVYASASSKFAAKIKNEISKKIDYPVIIKNIPPLYRVRIGPFYKMEDAQEALKSIREAGYRDAFIVEEIALDK